MKKSTAGLAVAATAGFVALSATPASAVTLPFQNCSEAASVGVYNIPINTPGYAPRLDADSDGFGCDAAGTPPYDASIVVGLMGQQGTTQQVTQMPTGGAATGVEVTQTDNTAALALGGGLVLALAAGGTYVVRRRAA